MTLAEVEANGLLGRVGFILRLRRDLKGSFKGDADIDIGVEADVDIDSYLGSLKGGSKSV